MFSFLEVSTLEFILNSKDFCFLFHLTDKRLEAVEGNLSRASRFLEELYELSSWMNETRDLLEGHKAGKAGYNVDPEVK